MHSFSAFVRRWRAAAVIVAISVVGGCDKDDPAPVAPLSVSTADLSDLETDRPTSTADGASLTEISATIPAASKLQPRIVAVSTTAGTFVQGGTTVTLTPNADGEIRVYLRAPASPATAFIRASAGQTVLTASLEFKRAYPDRIEVEPQRFSVQADTVKGGEEISVTAYLRRDTGTVSPGQSVVFEATPAGKANPKLGVATLSDGSGQATVRYSPGVTSYRGPVTITARTTGANGQMLTAATTVDIIAWKQ